MKYQVIDRQTRQVVSLYDNYKKASHAALKKDLEYGAGRYMVRRVES